MSIEPTGLRLVQFVNTLDIADGGPARNSFELNLSLNSQPSVDANLIWIRGSEITSVLVAHTEQLPVPGPRPIGFFRRSGERRITLLAAAREIRDADCVIVHGYYLPWIPVVAAVAAASGTPMVLMPHGALTDRQQKISRRRKAAYEFFAGRFVRNHLSSFVTGSLSESEEIDRRFPASASVVAGVGTRMREPTVPSGVHSPVRLLSVSRLAPKKRIDLMIEAVSILRSRGLNCQLTIVGVGDPAFTKSLKGQVTKLGVGDHVFFSGQLDGEAKHQIFWDSDIFLLPSDDENFGIALAEALAHGLPSVASVNVAASAAIEQWGGGRILQDRDANQLAEQVAELAQVSDFAQERRAAFMAANRSYTWSTVAARWISAIRTHL